jgi:hypothetical protein
MVASSAMAAIRTPRLVPIARNVPRYPKIACTVSPRGMSATDTAAPKAPVVSGVILKIADLSPAYPAM